MEAFLEAAGDSNNQRILNIHLPWQDGAVYFDCGADGAGNYDRIAKQADPADYKGKWSHWTFTKDAVAGEMKIYLNGQLWYMESGKTRSIPAATQVVFGCDRSLTYSYDGKVAELRIWNIALSPEQVLENVNGQPEDRFWRYLPFRGNTLQKLEALLQDSQAIRAYNDDPFDPDAIARVRLGTYQKNVVMRYIDNLLSWGDSLFAQDTWESITQATTLYLLAYDLLGPRPESVGACSTPAPKTFADIKAQYAGGNIPQFLLALEQSVGNNSVSTQVNPPFNSINAYFCVGENDQFIAYWDRVEDRLYKIRHCENIAGTVRQLALFEPPINPAKLVRAAAASNLPISVVTGLTAEVAEYRFETLLERAKNITSTLIQLGSSLLSVLEKKDVEQLSALRATQEAAVLQLIKTTRQQQIDQANTTLESLNQSLVAAQHRADYYQGLLTGGLSPFERDSQSLMLAALPFQSLAAGINAASAVLFLLPTIFGLADGGMEPGWALTSAASTFDGIASSASFMSLQIGSGIAQPLSFANNMAMVAVDLSADQFAGDWVIAVDLTKTPQGLLKNGVLDPALFQNVECILTYQGTIDWNR
jgi:hypothetical protein